jgi:SAM-dependent methyltransferase
MIGRIIQLLHDALPPLAPAPPNGVTVEQHVLAGHPIAGTCPVCGGRRVLFRGFTDNLRESGHCSQCGASNRQRQMAFALRAELGLALTGRLKPPRGCRVYSTEANGPLHEALAAAPGYVCSEYWGEAYAPGMLVNGVRNEDLERLSWPDASFDVVLSSDVLEHVADAYRAHREIFRVLRPGGRHIFTVPFSDGAALDDVRARLVNGQIEYLAEPLYHGDPVRPGQGVLVWRIFGAEMLTRLQDLGFAAEMLRLHEPRHGILGDNAAVFVARKR